MSMTTAMRENWQQANKQYLLAHLTRLKELLKQAECAPSASSIAEMAPPVMAHDVPASLDMLCEWFRLSEFERDIVLLCAAIELDKEFAALCALAQGNSQCNYPTFSLALAVFPGTHWSALAPNGPLRHWCLVEVEAGRSLTLSPLRIDERILHYLLGVSYLDQQLLDVFQPLSLTGALVPSHERVAHEIAHIWLQAERGEAMPVIQLCGAETISQRNIAIAACSLLGHRAYLASASLLPIQPGDLEHALHLWERETILDNNALFLDCQEVERADTLRESVIARVIEANKGLLIVANRERRAFSHRLLLTFDIEKPREDEQRTLWQSILDRENQDHHSFIEKLSSHFYLSSHAIPAVWAGVQARLAISSADESPTVETISDTIWDVCRVQARMGLDDLAQRIEPVATWADLVIPDVQRSILQDVAVHVRHRTQVYETWDFTSKGKRGLGISALFVGASGVGKTMAAEVLANELRLDVYRIDLSAVVSKYIGETEKNLRKVFDVAEGSGAILLFDEADALFGKRSEVKDSHDRYANIEVSYLLQRMEAYRGLAVLTTNMKDALDQAFLRRIRFIVQFPFPDAVQRAEIWRNVFPAATPTQGLDVRKLAQLNVAGGNIRNIALHAAFHAAADGGVVHMGHLLRAARYEYSKLEMSLTSAEIRGWDETGAI